MVEVAKSADSPIAAHCLSSATVIGAAKAGATTVEHGFEPNDETLEVMKRTGIIYIPTLAVCELFSLWRKLSSGRKGKAACLQQD